MRYESYIGAKVPKALYDQVVAFAAEEERQVSDVVRRVLAKHARPSVVEPDDDPPPQAA
jgi:hypothetical protein